MFGLITGSGFTELPDLVDPVVRTIETPYGDAGVTTGSWCGEPVAFVPRHGAAHSVPPAAINYRANIWALRDCGVHSVLATAVSGGIRSDMTPGRIVLISDFIDFTTGRADTFFDGVNEPFEVSRHHTDMTNAYSPRLREVVADSARREGLDIIDEGVYCATDGPRFESAAEIEMMRRMGGDLVGMTGYPEVALAVEAGLEYCSIGVIVNPAAGLGGALDITEIFTVLEGARGPLRRIIERTITGEAS